jgi:hypothetical protein
LKMKRFILIAVLCLLAGVGFGYFDITKIMSLAEQGNAQAQFELGTMYSEGQGIPRSYTKAVKWYQLAAYQGHSGAQNNLGMMYAEGKGVRRNYTEAYAWVSLVVAKGDTYAIINQRKLAKKLSSQESKQALQRIAQLQAVIQREHPEPERLPPPVTGDQSVPPTRFPKKVFSGTCFFVDNIGTAVTNNHVIEGHSDIEVVAANGSKSSAVVIKSSNSLDIAVLRTGHQTPQFLTIAPNGSLSLGLDVFTIGYPVTDILGDKPKYTEGSISALSGLNNDDRWMQVSTPVHPGNSGGPLVNDNGQVVGIVSATAAVEKFFAVTGSLPQNINWAIKAEYARAMIPGMSANTNFSTKKEAIAHTEKSICRVIAR